MLERLQKILSRNGIASRRAAEKFILSGKVRVNGKIVKLGDKADELIDNIQVNNKNLSTRAIIGCDGAKADTNNFVYYLLNKPVGYICSFRRKKNEKLTIDLVPKNPRVWTVGRLDKDSSGLLILTNNGQLTQELTHPKFEHEKEYLITVDHNLKAKFLSALKNGVKLTEGITQADEIKEINKRQFTITLHQGWKRQIRRMCYALGYSVLELKRIRIGKWKLGNLKEGEFYQISKIQFPISK